MAPAPPKSPWLTPAGENTLLRPSARASSKQSEPTPKPTVQTLASTLTMTGCRVSEALGIRACDVDLEAKEIRIFTLKRRRGWATTCAIRSRRWSTPTTAA